MRLREIVNAVSSRAREVGYFIRSPFHSISRNLQSRGQKIYEDIELPLGQDTPGKENSARKAGATSSTDATRAAPRQGGNAVSVSAAAPPELTMPKVVTATPQTTQRKANTIKVKSPSRQAESLPILPKDREIRGRRGRYRIDSLLKDGQRVRLYQGNQVLNNKPVLIKEYLLPERDFNQNVVRELKEKFELQTSVNLKSGLGQDFRLIGPWDAIAPLKEKCCYLVTERIDDSLTLREYLDKAGSMRSKQVRQVLNQVLQTLCFLHSQRIRLASGEVQSGLPHGNLSLDSLLIVSNNQQSATDDQQFFIYVSDLALWEHLFIPSTAKTVKPSVSQDLKDLGTASFYLLAGTTVDNVSRQPLDPKIKQQWPAINDAPLEGFIQRLLGLNGAFRSAEEARQELLRLPSVNEINGVASTNLAQEQEEVNRSYVLQLVLRTIVLGLLMGFVGTLIWLLFNWMRNGKAPVKWVSPSYTCCIKDVDVTGIPPGNITYTADTAEVWNYLLTQPSLVSPSRNFEDELKERGMKLPLVYASKTSTSSAKELVLNNQLDFFITSIIDESEKSINKEDLTVEPVAYNGIAVFVAFSDAQRKGNIAEGLHGKISFEQLRKLYTGKIKNWKELGDAMPDLPVKLYVTSEVEAINIFKSVVFKNHPEELRQFEKMLAQKKIVIKSTLESLRDDFLVNFEKNKNGSIGVGFINQIFNQCSVYPLAVGEENHEVQALALDNHQPLEPNIDLCNKKGSYRPDVPIFKSGEYPLGYKLVVVYPKDNKGSQAGKKFAEILTTDEGQSLLSEAGLVPLRALQPND